MANRLILALYDANDAGSKGLLWKATNGRNTLYLLGTIHLDRDDSPAITLVLYRYDGSTCLAEADGEPVSLVDRSLAMDVVEAVYAIVLK